jgi:hypothetical protein
LTDFEERLRELMKPVRAEWEERLAEVTGPQVDEVHRAERQLAKYAEAKVNPGEGSEFKSRLWVVFHAVEEGDWERLGQYWRVFDELRRLAKPLEVTYRGHVTLEEDINALEKFCRERSVEKAFWVICTILFGIDPPTGIEDPEEEEEYSAVREAALRARGVRLLP